MHLVKSISMDIRAMINSRTKPLHNDMIAVICADTTEQLASTQEREGPSLRAGRSAWGLLKGS